MEIRRRSRVVGVFPSVESYLRLTINYLVEYSEDWGMSTTISVRTESSGPWTGSMRANGSSG